MRQWKVGTISMGILLIAVGVLLALQQINGISSISIILRWWPIILILIGIEVLTYSYFTKQDSMKIKYDGLSIFIIIILIVFSLGAYAASSIPFGYVNTSFFNGFPNVYKNDSSYTKKLTIDPKTAIKVNVSNAYGNIVVEKAEGRKLEIDAEIRIRNNDEVYAKKISDKLIAVTQGEEVTITSRVKEYMNDHSKLQNISVNLKIMIPSGIEVSLVNEYGNITARNLTKDLKVIDRNGQINIEAINGALKVENQYGNIDASKITGSCDIENRNGQIIISDIGKFVKVENQYGNVSVEKVKDRVEISDRNADIEVTDVTGDLSIDSAYSGMRLNDINGNLTLKGKNANMDIQNIGGEIKAVNEYGQVTVTNAQKAVEIEDRNGNIELRSEKVFEGAIKLQNAYGNISLNIPSSQNAYITAKTSYGNINNDFNLNINSKENEKTIDQQLGIAGVKIDLKTKNGNIDIK